MPTFVFLLTSKISKINKFLPSSLSWVRDPDHVLAIVHHFHLLAEFHHLRLLMGNEHSFFCQMRDGIYNIYYFKLTISILSNSAPYFFGLRSFNFANDIA